MKPEDGARVGIVEHALLHHHRRAALLTGGRAFLGRLEDELDRAGNLHLHPRQHFGHTHHDRDVIVVAAGVHDAHVHVVVLGSHRALEREIDLLGDRQRVHVGAEGHHTARPSASQHPDHAGMSHTGLHLEPERLEMIGDQLRGPELPVPELGVLVDVTPPGHDLGHDLLHPGIDFTGQIVGRILPLGGGGDGNGEEQGNQDDRSEHATSERRIGRKRDDRKDLIQTYTPGRVSQGPGPSRDGPESDRFRP